MNQTQSLRRLMRGLSSFLPDSGPMAFEDHLATATLFSMYSKCDRCGRHNAQHHHERSLRPCRGNLKTASGDVLHNATCWSAASTRVRASDLCQQAAPVDLRWPGGRYADLRVIFAFDAKRTSASALQISAFGTIFAVFPSCNTSAILDAIRRDVAPTRLVTS